MEALRIFLFFGVGIFGVIFGVRNSSNMYIYGGIVLILIGLFNVFVAWKQNQNK